MGVMSAYNEALSNAGNGGVVGAYNNAMGQVGQAFGNANPQLMQYLMRNGGGLFGANRRRRPMAFNRGIFNINSGFSNMIPTQTVPTAIVTYETPDIGG